MQSLTASAAWPSRVRRYTAALLMAGATLLLGCGGDDSRNAPAGDTTGTSNNASSGSGSNNGSNGSNTDAGDSNVSDGGLSDAAYYPPFGEGDSGDYVPPEQPDCDVSSACHAYCDAVVVVDQCGAGDEFTCLCACEERLADPCPAALDNLIECAGAAPEVTCTSGARLFSGCQEQSNALSICEARAVGDLGDAGLSDCESFCEGVVQAGCQTGEVSLVGCIGTCQGNLAGGCGTEYQAMLACYQEPGDVVSCDNDTITLQGQCSAEWQTLLACVEN